MKKYQIFLSENFQYLEANFFIYLNRHVFVMLRMYSLYPILTIMSFVKRGPQNIELMVLTFFHMHTYIRD